MAAPEQARALPVRLARGNQIIGLTAAESQFLSGLDKDTALSARQRRVEEQLAGLQLRTLPVPFGTPDNILAALSESFPCCDYGRTRSTQPHMVAATARAGAVEMIIMRLNEMYPATGPRHRCTLVGPSVGQLRRLRIACPQIEMVVYQPFRTSRDVHRWAADRAHVNHPYEWTASTAEKTDCVVALLSIGNYHPREFSSALHSAEASTAFVLHHLSPESLVGDFHDPLTGMNFHRLGEKLVCGFSDSAPYADDRSTVAAWLSGDLGTESVGITTDALSSFGSLRLLQLNCAPGVPSRAPTNLNLLSDYIVLPAVGRHHKARAVERRPMELVTEFLSRAKPDEQTEVTARSRLSALQHRVVVGSATLQAPLFLREDTADHLSMVAVHYVRARAQINFDHAARLEAMIAQHQSSGFFRRALRAVDARAAIPLAIVEASARATINFNPIAATASRVISGSWKAVDFTPVSGSSIQSSLAPYASEFFDAPLHHLIREVDTPLSERIGQFDGRDISYLRRMRENETRRTAGILAAMLVLGGTKTVELQRELTTYNREHPMDAFSLARAFREAVERYYVPGGRFASLAMFVQHFYDVLLQTISRLCAELLEFVPALNWHFSSASGVPDDSSSVNSMDPDDATDGTGNTDFNFPGNAYSRKHPPPPSVETVDDEDDVRSSSNSSDSESSSDSDDDKPGAATATPTPPPVPTGPNNTFADVVPPERAFGPLNAPTVVLPGNKRKTITVRLPPAPTPLQSMMSGALPVPEVSPPAQSGISSFADVLKKEPVPVQVFEQKEKLLNPEPVIPFVTVSHKKKKERKTAKPVSDEKASKQKIKRDRRALSSTSSVRPTYNSLTINPSIRFSELKPVGVDPTRHTFNGPVNLELPTNASTVGNVMDANASIAPFQAGTPRARAPSPPTSTWAPPPSIAALNPSAAPSSTLSLTDLRERFRNVGSVPSLPTSKQVLRRSSRSLSPTTSLQVRPNLRKRPVSPSRESWKKPIKTKSAVSPSPSAASRLQPSPPLLRHFSATATTSLFPPGYYNVLGEKPSPNGD
jgi:hypothetical protein